MTEEKVQNKVQTIHWLKKKYQIKDRQSNDHDNKGVIRSLKSQKDRQYNDHDNKGVIRSLKSQKDRHHNDHDNKGVIRSLKSQNGQTIQWPR